VTTNNFIKEIIEEIQDNYADEITREKLEEGAINGMLAFLDEHSMYISREEFDAFNNSTRGTFLGIGVSINQMTKDGVEIDSVIDDTPAFKAGLKAFDIVTRIDDKPVSNMSIKDVVSKFSSDSAMRIKLSILRNKKENFDINIKKSVVQIKSVKLEFMENIAIIRISYFNETTQLEVTKAVRKIHKNKAVGVIIDLRGNPGGIVDQAINTSDLFLKNCKIVEFKSRKKEESKIIYADDIDLLEKIPIAVLIDKDSASGAELMAAAIAENKRGIIIGERSFGKGSLQSIIPLPGRGAIKLTTAFLLTPNGNDINHKGITPDIAVEQPADPESPKKDAKDITILKAADILRGISALESKKPTPKSK
jgi:carboxyl-terminal processing protease